MTGLLFLTEDYLGLSFSDEKTLFLLPVSFIDCIQHAGILVCDEKVKMLED